MSYNLISFQTFDVLKFTVVVSVSQVKGTDMYFFNVADGHGGWHCSSAIKYR